MARPSSDRFDTKAAAREAVWRRLESEGVARFPFPPHGRIPNFEGARAAAELLLEHEPWASARRIKVNPDAPQLPVRRLALERGIEVWVPTPRLRGGFRRLDPRAIPTRDLARAASLSGVQRFGTAVPLARIPAMDAIVVGSVAVTRRGRRCGKGEGYADLEYAILRELGSPEVPVATTVHEAQVVGSLPRDPTDLPVALVVTPERAHRVARPPAAPRGIDWSALGAGDLDAMPVLRELRDRRDLRNGPRRRRPRRA